MRRRAGWALPLVLALASGVSSCRSTSGPPAAAGGTAPRDRPEVVAAAAARPSDAGRAGLYTPAQARRGAVTFDHACSSCHATSHFSGPTFLGVWRGVSVERLYELIASTMPYDTPASLTRQEYVDVVAYLLGLNDLPSGDTELPADPRALSAMTIGSTSRFPDTSPRR